MVINKLNIHDFVSKEDVYSKLIRGKHDFYIEQEITATRIKINIYRQHPRVKEFVEVNETRHHLTMQRFEKALDTNLLKCIINDKEFMIRTTGGCSIKITEYNSNTQFQDFSKGKVAVFIDIVLLEENDNSKFSKELESFSLGGKNEG